LNIELIPGLRNLQRVVGRIRQQANVWFPCVVARIGIVWKPPGTVSTAIGKPSASGTILMGRPAKVHLDGANLVADEGENQAAIT
jgi:hypothetical protein